MCVCLTYINVYTCLTYINIYVLIYKYIQIQKYIYIQLSLFLISIDFWSSRLCLFTFIVHPDGDKVTGVGYREITCNRY